MTIAEIIKARNDGRVEDAYDAARSLYAADKGNHVKTLMFWTACDMLDKYLSENKIDEVGKIHRALLRLHSTMDSHPDDDTHHALQRIAQKVRQAHGQSRTLNHLELGQWGECIAADYLRQKGYQIISHDWQSGHRDIDIVAIDGTTTVFVEVKTRRNRTYSSPEFSVNHSKMRNIQRSIYHYLQSHNMGSDFRFDIITVVGTIGQQPEITHWTDISLME